MRSVALLAILLVAGCVAPSPRDVQPATAPPAQLASVPEPPVARFLAWGDSGYLGAQQNATAAGATRVCALVGCDFGLQLGDNIYDDGVDGPDDPQFAQKWEAPFANLSFPFYVVLGNHDDERGNGDHQVAYAQSGRSARWTMPARDYVVERDGLLLAALDLTRPDAAQAARLDAAAARSNATWRIAFGHFPYASHGEHGNATGDVRAFLREHVCGRFDLYVSGHDHDLEWLAAPDCAGTELVVSGAVSQRKPLAATAPDAFFAAGDVNGFFWFEARGGQLVGRAYAADETVLFERSLHKNG